MVKKVSIIIPTYNEAQNIAPLLTQINTVIAPLQDYQVTIVVADDSSPDDTADIVQSLTHTFTNIRLLSGPKEGMGAAYMRTIPTLLMSSDIIITMDADFSHPPHMIPQFLNTIHQGWDVVIGSRYIEGGKTVNWPLSRQITSFLANFLARTLGGLHTVHDCTSSYRAIRTSLLKEIPLDSLSTRGYAFAIASLWEYIQNDANICEIPLIFIDRTLGATKLRLTDIIEYVVTCLILGVRSFINNIVNQ